MHRVNAYPTKASVVAEGVGYTRHGQRAARRVTSSKDTAGGTAEAGGVEATNDSECIIRHRPLTSHPPNGVVRRVFVVFVDPRSIGQG